MKNVVVMDGEMHSKSIEKSPILISVGDIGKNITLPLNLSQIPSFYEPPKGYNSSSV